MPIVRRTDSQSSYYQWGNHGHKYRYTTGVATERMRAKHLAGLQAKAAYSRGYSGSGIVQNVFNFVHGRPIGSPALDKLLREHGDEIVIQVAVGRVPIASAVHAALSALTLGGINRVPFDKLFHLFANIFTEKSRSEIEKNEIVRVGPARGARGGEYKVAWTRSSGSQVTTLREFIYRGFTAVGKERFFTYRAFSWNCQDFVANCLLAPNGMLTPDLRAFILQDPRKILEHVPGYTSGVANALTDIAARGRTLIGQGVR